MFNLNWNDVLPIMTILIPDSPEAQPYCDLFNWYFSLMCFFGMVGFFGKMILRAISRS